MTSKIARVITIDILENDGRSVLFSSEKGLVRVPECGFMPYAIKSYTGRFVEYEDFWEIIQRNGTEQFFN